MLQAILLLAQTLEDTTSRQSLVTSGSYIDLGGYFDIQWGGQSNEPSSFSIELNISPESADRGYFETAEDSDRPTNLDITFALDAERNAIVVSSASITGGNTTFAAARRSGKGYSAPHLSDAAREQLNLNFRHF